MLIVPIENRPDWSRPPVITLALILLNIAIFIFYQGSDEAVVERAYQLYESQQLLDYERQPYLDYLRREDPDSWSDLSNIDDEAHQSAVLRWQIMFDRTFDQHLRTLWPTAADEQTLHWQHAREMFERERNQLSSYRGGLTPAEARPITFLTSMFLHGGWDHLLGNMIFLFLFGFTLEAVLRPHTYVLMYLASGLAASALHMSFNLGSMVPVIGASGAISGLMGMYLSLYRLRRIRFFYTVGFYFGEFRAPALFILPLWLGKELYGYFFFESAIAYWAHIGGLVAGAGLMLLANQSRKKFAGELQQQDAHDETGEKLKEVQLLINRLEFEQAKIQTRKICQAHPNDPRPWQQLFDLHKGQPRHKAFHQLVFDILKQFVAKGGDFHRWHNTVNQVLGEYRGLSPKIPALNGGMCLALARTYWQNGKPDLAADYVSLAHQRGGHSYAMAKLLNEMIPYYQRRQKTEQAAKLTAILKRLRPPITAPGPVQPD